MKYIDADKLIAEIEKRQEARQDRRDSASWENEYWPESEFSTRDDEDDAILSIITSLQQEPPINTELCTLIACDVIQATVKKAIEKPQDKDKEEDLMIKKMEYLNMLEKSFFQQEQPSLPSNLDEAAENYYEQDCPYPGEARVVNNEHDVWFPSRAIEDAFIAGAEWRDAQGVNYELEVKADAGGYPYIDKTFELYDYTEDKPIFNPGDIVIVNIRKKEGKK